MVKKNVQWNFFGQTKFLVKKKSGQNSFWSYKNFGHENILVNKFFLVKKKFGQRKVCEKNFSIEKSFGRKILVQNIFWLLSKKMGRVNPGAGIYDPPPSRK